VPLSSPLTVAGAVSDSWGASRRPPTDFPGLQREALPTLAAIQLERGAWNITQVLPAERGFLV